jgi:MoxR-like ATPase
VTSTLLDDAPSSTVPSVHAHVHATPPVDGQLEEVLFELRRLIVGQDRLLECLLVALLARGHVLLEGVPGLAKTATIKALAQVVGGTFGRVQFTPDLVPADLVGTRMYTGASGGFITELGPVFANLLLADEINRSSAKVQSALLEVMQEHQVTIGKETFRVPEPFLVLATQNPIESDGTYPLPEAQLDRFMFKVLVDYPSYDDELVVVQRVTGPAINLRQVLTPAKLIELQESADGVYVDPRVVAYAVKLVDATRNPAAHGLPQLAGAIQFGASPRASINLVAAARALAILRGRRYALATDVEYLAPEILRHRLVLTYESLAAGGTADAAIRLFLSQHPAPRLDLADRDAA